MNLLKINLLPYREEREAKRKQQFNVIMGVGVIAGLLACGGVYMALEQMLERQESRNTSLQAGIDELKKQVEQIKSLEQDKQRFLERKRKVEELDYKRFDGARIVDSLNQIVPEGSHLTALKGEGLDANGAVVGQTYLLEGRALSDNKVAILMAALPSTGIFDLPELVEIKKEEDAQRFVLKTKLVDQVALASLLAAEAAANKSKVEAASEPAQSAPAQSATPSAPPPAPSSSSEAPPPPPPPADSGGSGAPAVDAPPPPPAGS